MRSHSTLTALTSWNKRGSTATIQINKLQKVHRISYSNDDCHLSLRQKRKYYSFNYIVKICSVNVVFFVISDALVELFNCVQAERANYGLKTWRRLVNSEKFCFLDKSDVERFVDGEKRQKVGMHTNWTTLSTLILCHSGSLVSMELELFEFSTRNSSDVNERNVFQTLPWKPQIKALTLQLLQLVLNTKNVFPP